MNCWSFTKTLIFMNASHQVSDEIYEISSAQRPARCASAIVKIVTVTEYILSRGLKNRPAQRLQPLRRCLPQLFFFNFYNHGLHGKFLDIYVYILYTQIHSQFPFRISMFRTRIRETDNFQVTNEQKPKSHQTVCPSPSWPYGQDKMSWMFRIFWRRCELVSVFTPANANLCHWLIQVCGHDRLVEKRKNTTLTKIYSNAQSSITSKQKDSQRLDKLWQSLKDDNNPSESGEIISDIHMVRFSS